MDLPLLPQPPRTLLDRTLALEAQRVALAFGPEHQLLEAIEREERLLRGLCPVPSVLYRPDPIEEQLTRLDPLQAARPWVLEAQRHIEDVLAHNDSLSPLGELYRPSNDFVPPCIPPPPPAPATEEGQERRSRKLQSRLQRLKARVQGFEETVSHHAQQARLQGIQDGRRQERRAWVIGLVTAALGALLAGLLG